MKTSIFFLLFLIIQFTKGNWIVHRDPSVYLENNRTTSVYFSTNAERIVWNVECSTFCNVYLLDYETSLSFPNHNKQNFTSLYKSIGVHKADGEYGMHSMISKRLVVGIETFNSSSVVVNMIRREKFYPKFDVNWGIWIVGVAVIVFVVIFAVISVGLAYVYFIVKNKKAVNEHGQIDHSSEDLTHEH
eukprot:gene10126-2545_t